MTPEFAIEIGRNTLWTLFTMAAPLVFGALVVGFFVGMIQSLTQIREMTLTFVPKILAIGTLLWLMSPYILRQLVDYTTVVFSMIEDVGF